MEQQNASTSDRKTILLPDDIFCDNSVVIDYKDIKRNFRSNPNTETKQNQENGPGKPLKGANCTEDTSFYQLQLDDIDSDEDGLDLQLEDKLLADTKDNLQLMKSLVINQETVEALSHTEDRKKSLKIGAVYLVCDEVMEKEDMNKCSVEVDIDRVPVTIDCTHEEFKKSKDKGSRQNVLGYNNLTVTRDSRNIDFEKITSEEKVNINEKEKLENKIVVPESYRKIGIDYIHNLIKTESNKDLFDVNLAISKTLGNRTTHKMNDFGEEKVYCEKEKQELEMEVNETLLIDNKKLETEVYEESEIVSRMTKVKPKTLGSVQEIHNVVEIGLKADLSKKKNQGIADKKEHCQNLGMMKIQENSEFRNGIVNEEMLTSSATFINIVEPFENKRETFPEDYIRNELDIGVLIKDIFSEVLARVIPCEQVELEDERSINDERIKVVSFMDCEETPVEECVKVNNIEISKKLHSKKQQNVSGVVQNHKKITISEVEQDNNGNTGVDIKLCEKFNEVLIEKTLKEERKFLVELTSGSNKAASNLAQKEVKNALHEHYFQSQEKFMLKLPVINKKNGQTLKEKSTLEYIQDIFTEVIWKVIPGEEILVQDHHDSSQIIEEIVANCLKSVPIKGDGAASDDLTKNCVEEEGKTFKTPAGGIRGDSSTDNHDDVSNYQRTKCNMEWSGCGDEPRMTYLSRTTPLKRTNNLQHSMYFAEEDCILGILTNSLESAQINNIRATFHRSAQMKQQEDFKLERNLMEPTNVCASILGDILTEDVMEKKRKNSDDAVIEEPLLKRLRKRPVNNKITPKRRNVKTAFIDKILDEIITNVVRHCDTDVIVDELIDDVIAKAIDNYQSMVTARLNFDEIIDKTVPHQALPLILESTTIDPDVFIKMKDSPLSSNILLRRLTRKQWAEELVTTVQIKEEPPDEIEEVDIKPEVPSPEELMVKVSRKCRPKRQSQQPNVVRKKAAKPSRKKVLKKSKPEVRKTATVKKAPKKVKNDQTSMKKSRNKGISKRNQVEPPLKYKVVFTQKTKRNLRRNVRSPPPMLVKTVPTARKSTTKMAQINRVASRRRPRSPSPSPPAVFTRGTRRNSLANSTSSLEETPPPRKKTLLPVEIPRSRHGLPARVLTGTMMHQKSVNVARKSTGPRNNFQQIGRKTIRAPQSARYFEPEDDDITSPGPSGLHTRKRLTHSPDITTAKRSKNFGVGTSILPCVVRLERMPIIDRLLPSRKAKQDSHICELCEPKRLFVTKIGLEEHIKKEHALGLPANADRCPGCDKKYHSQNRLAVHMKTCPAVADLSQSTVKVINLRKQMTRMQKPQEEPHRHTCEYCGSKFTLYSAYESHKRSHIELERDPLNLDDSYIDQESTGSVLFQTQMMRRGAGLKMKIRKEIIPCPKPVYSCDTCGVPFDRFDALHLHKASHRINIKQERISPEIEILEEYLAPRPFTSPPRPTLPRPRSPVQVARKSTGGARLSGTYRRKPFLAFHK